VLVGSHRLFDERGLCDHALDPELRRLEDAGRTAVMVAAGDAGGAPGSLRLLGILGIADAPRPEAAAAVAALEAAGLRVAMITGDNPRTAAAIGARVGIGEQRAEQLPEQKASGVLELTRRWGPLAMVGDGVNDAPALATASVGIAMGGRGSDAALESADVALLSDDLGRIAQAVSLGRATRRVIAWNVGLALGVKLAVLLLALAGYGSLWAAVAADMGASLLVVANGLRLLHAAGPADAPSPAAQALPRAREAA
jgi:Cd2+/Zn2+-exporting ATPase